MAKWRTGFDKEIHDAWKKYRENGGKKGYNEYLVDKHKQAKKEAQQAKKEAAAIRKAAYQAKKEAAAIRKAEKQAKREANLVKRAGKAYKEQFLKELGLSGSDIKLDKKTKAKKLTVLNKQGKLEYTDYYYKLKDALKKNHTEFDNEVMILDAYIAKHHIKYTDKDGNITAMPTVGGFFQSKAYNRKTEQEAQRINMRLINAGDTAEGWARTLGVSSQDLLNPLNWEFDPNTGYQDSKQIYTFSVGGYVWRFEYDPSEGTGRFIRIR